MTRSFLAAALLLAACSFDTSGLRPASREAGELGIVDLLADRAGDLGSSDARLDRGSVDRPGETATDGTPPGLTPLAVDDGRLWLAQASGAPLRLLTFHAQSLSFTEESILPAVSGQVLWIAYQILPAGEELVAFKVKTGGGHALELWRSTGGAWQQLASQPTGGPETRDFHLVREELSGAALLVHGDGSARPSYQRIANGLATPTGGLPLNDGGGPGPDLSTGKLLWVELVPLPKSNELTLLFVEENASLIAIRWDGAQWESASAIVLETGIKKNEITSTISNRSFDGAYEESTGAIVAAWATETNGFYWRRKPAGGSWTTTAKVAVFSGVPHHVDLVGAPGSDRVAGGFFDLGDGTERLGLATWDGKTWIGAKEYDLMRDLNDDAVGDFPGAVAWRGASKQAVAVYPDETSGQIDHATWTKGDWTVEKDVAVAGKGFTESALLRSLGQSDKLVLVASDELGALHFASYDGAWTVAPKPLSTTLPAKPTTVPFALELKR